MYFCSAWTTRGIKDVFLFCVDGLTGFRQAIEAAFPNAQIQRCIIHQIRSSTRFVSYKHIKELMSDLKKVYQAISEEEAMNNLILFKDKWGKTYPIGIFSPPSSHIRPRFGR